MKTEALMKLRHFHRLVSITEALLSVLVWVLCFRLDFFTKALRSGSGLLLLVALREARY